MTTKRSDFVAEVYCKNRPYTAKEVWDYIEGTRQIKFADPQEIKTLIKKSIGKLKSSVIKYGIRLHKPLQFETSPAGKDLAKLILSHCNKTIRLIVDEKKPFEGFLIIK